MKTLCYFVDKNNPDISILAEAADILRRGGLVAFPTETVYGLGANGLDAKAAQRIYQAKGRPSDNPLILHISSVKELEQLVAKITPQTEALINKYWPGPLTVVLEKSAIVPDIVTGGLKSVAVRMPDSKVARKLIKLAGVPIAAPSANKSERPSPTNAQAVLADLDGRIDAVIDAGPCTIGLESTIVDLTSPVPALLRPGGITYEMLAETLGEIDFAQAERKDGYLPPKAPGMKYLHYAPRYPMVLAVGAPERSAALLKQEIGKALAENKRVGAVVSSETAKGLPREVIASDYGPRSDIETIASRLYDALRYFDNHEVDIIFAEGVQETGLGVAVMNRLRKAAGNRFLK